MSLTPEAIIEKWETITTFDDGWADHPESPQDGLKAIMANIMGQQGDEKSKRSTPTSSSGSGVPNKEILANIEKAKKAKAEGTEYSYDDKEIIIYSELASFYNITLIW